MARLSRVERKDLAKESSVIFLEGGAWVLGRDW